MIDYLARSQAPVRLQSGKMQTAYRALLRIHDNPDRAAASVLTHTGVWFKAPPSTDWSAHARDVVARQVRVLRAAPLYVMAPSMCDVTTAAAQTLTMSDLALLDETDPPTREGFLLLPHPVVSDDGTGLGYGRAIAWSFDAGWYRDDTGGPGRPPRAAGRLRR